jgi:hypothetical protein
MPRTAIGSAAFAFHSQEAHMDTDLPKPGPVINNSIQEVQGIFPSDAALQDAVGRLTRIGFDRASLSLPAASPSAAHATPNEGAANPDMEDDARQIRTLGSSTAATIGAAVGAGLTVATGGAALPALAAAAGLGLMAGGGVFAATTAASEAQHDERTDAAHHGELVLAVNLRNAGDAPKAEAAMREAGATRVESVTRHGAGLAG